MGDIKKVEDCDASTMYKWKALYVIEPCMHE